MAAKSRRVRSSDRKASATRRLSFDVLEERWFLSAHYGVTDLGTIPGGTWSNAYGINDSGMVVGEADTASGLRHAFLYSNGTMTDLGTLGGFTSCAEGINDSGQVVGWSDTASGLQHAFLYSNGTMTDLGTLGGGYSHAYAINDSGEVVGWADTQMDSGRTHAFLYSNGTMTDLGTARPNDNSVALAINDNGQTAGSAVVTGIGGHGYNRAFLYSNGTMTDLGTLPGFAESGAAGINNSGQVVGWNRHASVSHAFLYNDGTMTDLGAIADDDFRVLPLAINDSGQVVGMGQNGGFLYSNGTRTDLAMMSGLSWFSPSAINNKGQVVGGNILLSPVIVGPVDVAYSTLTVSPPITALGGTATLTLVARDANGNQEPSGGLVVGLGLGAGTVRGNGTFSAVTDNGDGTYTATLTATTVGSNIVTATINGQLLTSLPPVVTFVGPVSLVKSTVTVWPSQIVSGTTAWVTLVARDANGKQQSIGGLTVEFTVGNGAARGSFSTVTDNGDGTYSAMFRTTTAGSNTIIASIGAKTVTSKRPVVKVVPGPISLSQSTVTVSKSSIVSGGTVIVTLTARDNNGNRESRGGLVVDFVLAGGSAGGTFGRVTDRKNGTYTATFSASKAGYDTIFAIIGGKLLTSKPPTLVVTPKPASASRFPRTSLALLAAVASGWNRPSIALDDDASSYRLHDAALLTLRSAAWPR